LDVQDGVKLGGSRGLIIDRLKV